MTLYPISERHHRKYSALCDLWGVSFGGETVLGRTRTAFLRALAVDPHLNNVVPLNRWDRLAARYMGCPQPYDSEGRLREAGGLGSSASLSEAVCAVKHAVALWAGAEFVLVRWDDPALRSPYPRRPEWGTPP